MPNKGMPAYVNNLEKNLQNHFRSGAEGSFYDQKEFFQLTILCAKIN